VGRCGNSANAAERFLLVYPDPEHFADTDKRVSSRTDTLYVGTGCLMLGTDQKSDWHAAADGKLKVTLAGESVGAGTQGGAASA
jgi:hypothetical protein